VALSAVEDTTKNMINVILGTIGLADQQELEGLERVLGQIKVILLQLKIPLFLEPFPVTALDTGSTIDTLNGALAVALSVGLLIEVALQ
jgi:hypothetical protein